MRLTIELDHGSIVIHQTVIPVARYVIGVPLLLGGLWSAVGVVTSLTEGVRQGSVEAILGAALGAWWLLLLTAMVLPLGWWLTCARRYIVIEPAGPQVVEVHDWRVGRKTTRTPAAAFRAVRVAAEPVDSSPGGNDGPTTYCQQIRLLARDPARQPSIEIGAVELTARADAIAAAQRVGNALGLPVEVADADARLDSPAREAALAEVEEDDMEAADEIDDGRGDDGDGQDAGDPDAPPHAER
ncbi:MAG: hypothetical protein AB7O28_00550 [Vicinamibacterales bacterium]